MYALGRGLIHQMTKKDEYNIAILGLDDAGKTTLLERIKSIFNGTPMVNSNKIWPTVGMNIGKIDHKRIRLNFWDVGGQQDLQVLWDKYISECHGIVFVVDASNESRLNESQETFSKVIGFEKIRKIPLLILFNKCETNSESPDLISIRQYFAESRINDAKDEEPAEMRIISVSAIEGSNVEIAIKWLADSVTRQYSEES